MASAAPAPSSDARDQNPHEDFGAAPPAPAPKASARARTAFLERAATPALLALIVATVAIWNARFILRDHADLSGVDDSDSYMDYAFQYYRAFSDGFSWRDLTLLRLKMYSPLHFILGGLVLWATEPSRMTLRLYTSGYLPLALIYVFLLSRIFMGRWAALLAVFIGGTASIAMESARYFSLDAVLVLPLAGSLYHLARSEGMTRVGHTSAAMGHILFGALIKLAFPMLVFPAFALVVIVEYVALARGKKWRALGIAAGSHAAIALALLWLVKYLVPNFMDYLNVAQADPEITRGFRFVVPYHSEGIEWLRNAAYWATGIAYTFRRTAWPLVALAGIGIAIGVLRLRDRRRLLAFLSVPIVFLTANYIYVSLRVHYDFLRYFGPFYALFGVMAAGSVAWIGSRRIQRALLGALTAYAVAGWIGPQILPTAFDCRPSVVLPGFRYDAVWLMNRPSGQFPEFVFKLWDEPAARPTGSYGDDKIFEALELVSGAAPLGEPLHISVIGSDSWDNGTAYDYEHKSTDRLLFEFGQTPGDMLKAQYTLVLGMGFTPAYTHIRESESYYRAALIAAESKPLQTRLGWILAAQAITPEGGMLRLFKNEACADNKQALERMLVWRELLEGVNPADPTPLYARGTEWLQGAGFGDAGAAFASILEFPAMWESTNPALANPTSHRYVEWLQLMKQPPTAEKPAALLKVVQTGLPAGPGMIFASAESAFQCYVELQRNEATNEQAANARKIALLFARFNLENYPAHLDSWTWLNQRGFYLQFSAELAAMGESQAKRYARDARILDYDTFRDGFSAMRQLASLGFPQFLNRELERLEEMKRTHPDSLKTLMLAAADQESAGQHDAMLEKRLEQACGQSGTYMLDYELHTALGRLRMQRGETRSGERNLRLGGWAGVRALLEWQLAHESTADYEDSVREFAGFIEPRSIQGNDWMRTEAIRTIGATDADFSMRNFVQMNSGDPFSQWPLFTQLTSQYDAAEKKRFEKSLREERVNFYSPTRPDFFRGALGVSLEESKTPAFATAPSPDELTLLSIRQLGFEAIGAARKTPVSGEPVLAEVTRETLAVEHAAAGQSEARTMIFESSFSYPTAGAVFARVILRGKLEPQSQARLELSGRDVTGQWRLLAEAPILCGMKLATWIELPVKLQAECEAVRLSISSAPGVDVPEITVVESGVAGLPAQLLATRLQSLGDALQSAE